MSAEELTVAMAYVWQQAGPGKGGARRDRTSATGHSSSGRAAKIPAGSRPRSPRTIQRTPPAVAARANC